MRRERLHLWASTLMKVAGKAGVLESVTRELDGFAQVFNDHPEFVKKLQNPLIPLATRETLIEKVSAESHPVTGRFLLLLLKNYILEDLSQLLEEVEMLKITAEGGLAARLVLPEKVDQDTLDLIARRVEALTGKKPTFTVKIDPSLLGGFLMKSESYLIDATMTGMLKKIGAGG